MIPFLAAVWAAGMVWVVLFLLFSRLSGVAFTATVEGEGKVAIKLRRWLEGSESRHVLLLDALMLLGVVLWPATVFLLYRALRNAGESDD